MCVGISVGINPENRWQSIRYLTDPPKNPQAIEESAQAKLNFKTFIYVILGPLDAAIRHVHQIA
jgi:hypothetical protein